MPLRKLASKHMYKVESLRPPSIEGIALEGQRLSIDLNVWSGSYIVYSYVWLADGMPIPGEDDPTLDLTTGEVGEIIECDVTGENELGEITIRTLPVGPVGYASGVLAIFGTPVTTALVGSPYAGFTATATGGSAPYQFTKVSGPSWLSVGLLTGVVSGTPSIAASDTNIVIRVTDNIGAFVDLAPFDVVVSPIIGALEIFGTPVFTATQNVAYAGFTASAAGGVLPYTFSISAGTLPTGITINASTGVVGGTPTGSGTSSGIRIRVTDFVGSTAHLDLFSITVTAAVSSYITAAEILGDQNYIVQSGVTTSPSGLTSVPVFCNGWMMRLTVDPAKIPTAIDATKIMLTVRDYGWATDGTQTSYIRYIFGRRAMHAPKNGAAVTYEPSSTQVDIVLSASLYRDLAANDSSGRQYVTEVIGVRLYTGYFSGAVAASFPGPSVTRSDNRTYPTVLYKRVDPICRPPMASTVRSEWYAAHKHAMKQQAVACVESWFSNANSSVSADPGARPVSRATAPVVSTYSGPTCPSGFSVPVFVTNADHTGLTDGRIWEMSQVKPWIGPINRSWDVGTDTSVNYSFNLMSGYPECRDAAGQYNPVYCYVNADGTGLAGTSSAGGQVTLTDPGAALSYKDIDAAMIGGRAKLTALGKTLSSFSGVVVVLRAVNQTGAGVGSDLAAYCNRVQFSQPNFGGGMVMPIIMGLPTSGDAIDGTVRMRPNNQAGTGLSASQKQTWRQIHWKNIYFDGYQVINNPRATTITAPDTQASAPISIMTDCVTTKAGSANNQGMRYRYRHRMLDHDFAEPNYGAWSGPVIEIGSRYTNTSDTLSSNLPQYHGGGCVLACWIHGGISAADVRTKEVMKAPIISHSRFDGVIGDGATFQFGGTDASCLRDGIAVVSTLFRRVTGGGGYYISFGPDGSIWEMRNVILQHLSTGGGANNSFAANSRINGFYNDRGYAPVRKEGVFQNCSIMAYANKDGEFNANNTGEETTGTTWGQAWSPGRDYYMGEAFKSGTDLWQCLRRIPPAESITYATAGAVPSDAALSIPGGYGAFSNSKTRRNGNSYTRMMIDSEYTVTCQAVGGPIFTDTRYDSWIGTLTPYGSGTKFGQANPANFYAADNSDQSDALTNLANSNYRPKLGGELVNMIPTGVTTIDGVTYTPGATDPITGFEIMCDKRKDPFDPLGTVRKIDGTGAACWLEHL